MIFLTMCIAVTITIPTPSLLGVTITLCAVCSLILIFRLLLKSKHVTRYLMFSLKFSFDLAIHMIGLGIFGSSYGVNSTPLLILFFLIFMDWRLADANVLPTISPFRPSYFIPILAALVLIPSMYIAGNLQGLSNTNSIYSSAFANLSEFDNVTDVFELSNPPRSIFSRVRSSQAFMDGLLIFDMKLLVDFLHQWFGSRSKSGYRFDYLIIPVLFEYSRFDEEPRSGNVINDLSIFPQQMMLSQGMMVSSVPNSTGKLPEVIPEETMDI
jgi:hypothetical protein